jgi:dTDP-4-amino-4,6-dideoxygalactose transaminase
VKSTTDALLSQGRSVPFLDLSRQYEEIRDEIDLAVGEVIARAAFVGGDHVDEFESAFATYVQARHAIGVANGTDAIELALEALDLPPGSEVIVPANSFIATSEAVSRCGLQVVFADVDARGYTLDVDDVRSRVTSRTSAIIAVHLYGHPADMGNLSDLCRTHGLRLIEDAAQAHGARYGHQRVGALADVGCFSFYPGKNLGAYGDAGAVTTNDPALAKRIRMAANHGRVAKYDHAFEGRNSRLDGLQAAILSVKLGHLDVWTARRQSLAQQYIDELGELAYLTLPRTDPGVDHVYHLFVVRSRDRTALQRWLSQHGIATGIHYPVALPRLMAYRGHPQHDEPLCAVSLADEVLSLPMSDSIRADEVAYVCQVLRAFTA